MKQTILSILAISFLLLPSVKIHAQEELDLDEESTLQEQDQDNTEKVVIPEESDQQTLDDALDENVDTSPKVNFSFFQIFVAITAPLTFLGLAYMLIKKLKL
jgi:hypothetical protein